MFRLPIAMRMSSKVPADVSTDAAPLTAIEVPTVPLYGPPAFAFGPTTRAGAAVSPLALYADTTTVCWPPVNGRGIEQLHAPLEATGVSL